MFTSLVSDWRWRMAFLRRFLGRKKRKLKRGGELWGVNVIKTYIILPKWGKVGIFTLCVFNSMCCVLVME